MAGRSWAHGAAVVLASVAATPALALQFELDFGDGITGALNSSVTLGAQWRMENRDLDILGKGNNFPTLCGTRDGVNANSCQGTNQLDVYPSRTAETGRGTSSINFDDGNLNYDKGDIVQAPLKITQDMSVSYGEYGFFGRWILLHDFVNVDLKEYHPNQIGPDTVPKEPEALEGTGPTYGHGDVIENRRAEPEAIRQVGSDLQILDSYIYGFFPFFGDRELTLKLGRQSLSWGETLLLVLNSLNQVNPVNANNFNRLGWTPEEVFTSVGMLYANTSITDNLSIEAWSQYEWKPVEAQTPGSFYSTNDAGTNNLISSASISFGNPAEDPLRRGTPLNNPLSGLTDSTTQMVRRRDKEPGDSGQWGMSMKYFAEDFNNGTEFGFYFMNYHSKLPYIAFYGSDLSCARTHPNAPADPDSPTGVQGARNGQDATDLGSLGLACPNLPAINALLAGGATGGLVDLTDLTNQLGALNLPGVPTFGSGPITDAVPLDTVEFQFEYPRDRKMYGMSFNTSFGDLALQGEIAYRPNLPLQVDLEDLTFAALGPTLASCHRGAPGGSDPGSACDPNLSQSGPNTFNIIPSQNGSDPSDPPGDGGDAPSSQRSFPSFVTSYRGITVGENDPNGYIRGFEEANVLQYNLGGTYILGKTANPIGADQVIFFFEIGASQVLNMPKRHILQIEAPATHLHASAGASDLDESATAAVNPVNGQLASVAARQDAPGCFEGICVAGSDGLRFNPVQETLPYSSAWAWGWRVIAIVRYDSVLPGISLEPFITIGNDVNGIAPGPGDQMIEGRKNYNINVQIRYKSDLSLNVGYQWFTGGGVQNLLNDRDTSHAYIKYQF